jgi:thioredoxin-related protein
MYRLIHSLVLITAIAFSVHFASAQSTIDKGVHFEHGLNWSAIKLKAIAEHKYIFVDCSATWCGPCRYMSNTIFPTQIAGDFFNSRFISVKVQMDSSAKDDEEVKKWYADAHQIMAQYNVQAFPTFLIFAPNGSVIHRIVGGEYSTRPFIARVRKSFDPSKQYYTQLLQFKDGRRDSSFLRRLTYQCLEVQDRQNGLQAYQAWQKTQANPYSFAGLDLLEHYVKHLSDPGFDLLVQHAAEANKIMGEGWAERLVKYAIVRDYILPSVNQGSNDPNWDGMQQAIAPKYPGQADEAIALGKVIYYQHVKEWPDFQTAILAYMQKYGAHATPDELNNYAYTVFNNCPDMNCVTGALDWSKRSFENKPDPLFINTYANILYKMGKKNDAIAWEQKAIGLSNGDDQYFYQSNLDKMKRDEKTWN